MINTPLLSICSITYNHEKYISLAIDSFLMQKTNFNYEIVIADDASKDNSQEIIKKYQKENPDKIKALLRYKNVGMQKNWLEALQTCTGKYIAICEGDDYWTDPYKLQKQVDFLEGNPDYGLVHTDCDCKYQEEGLFIHNSNKVHGVEVSSGDLFEKLLMHNFIYTLTVLCKADLIRKAVDNIYGIQKKWLMGDYPLWLEISNYTKIGYINFSTACYRVHNNSVSGRNSNIKKLDFFVSSIEVRNYFINRYKSTNDKQIKTKYYKTFLLKAKGVRFRENKHKYLLFTGFLYLLIQRKISFSDIKNFILSIIAIKRPNTLLNN